MPRKRKDSKETSHLSMEKNNDEKICRERVSRWSRKIVSWNQVRESFERIQGFRLSDLTSYERFTRLMYRPTDPASLGIARALFGFCMVLDVVEERGLADIDLKWGDPNGCHFPLIHGMERPSLPVMIIIYGLMWIGAFGIMLGLYFKIACACFVIPYWYIFLLDKSFWNNHTYLYGIVASLFWVTDANRYFSLDAKLSKEKNTSVPLWNYFILRFQFFALYFIAGLKKSSKEWLEGYAMTNLSRHWVFDPFKSFLTTQQTDFLIVHWFAFVFDLTVGFWMLFPKTRIPAMFFCTAFHLMNSRLFSIGMFPYVCLVTMPLFCSTDWPRKIIDRLSGNSTLSHDESVRTDSINRNSQHENFSVIEERKKNPEDEIVDEDKREIKRINDNDGNDDDSDGDDNDDEEDDNDKSETRVGKREIDSKKKSQRISKKRKLVIAVLLLHVALQFFLPYSHFITKGYNNWVPGLYGYSWDMMVHAWDITLVVIRVHDNENNEDLFMNPRAWVQNDRWAKHGDMVRQHAQCLKDNLMRRRKRMIDSPRKMKNDADIEWSKLSTNISIYVDVWCSLNGRFQQRIFDPNVDMLTADWHPLKPVSYLMPLLSQFSSYRYKLDEIQKDVYTWSNYTDVLFVADYPGMQLDNYMSDDFVNVSVSVLEGSVAYTEEGWTSDTTVTKGDRINVATGKFHTIRTISSYPSCYMYTYVNQTEQEINPSGSYSSKRSKESLPIFKEFNYKVNAWLRALGHIANSFFYLVYDVPMVRRVRNY